MSYNAWINCDECGERAAIPVEYLEVEPPAKWMWRDGKDYCPACALLLPPLPEPEPHVLMTQVSVAYQAQLEEYVRSKDPGAVGILSEDGKTVTFKFSKERGG